MSAAYVQKIADNVQAATPSTTSVTANSTVGNLAILLATSGSGIRATGITDTKGNSWTIVAQTTTGRTITIAYAVLAAALTTSDTLSITWSGTPVTASVLISEYSGLAATPFDKQNATAFTAVTSGASGTTGTLSQASELIISAASTNLLATFTAPSGFTDRGQSAAAVANSTGMDSADLVVAATAAQNPSWAFSTTVNTGVAVVSFKIAAGGVTVSPTGNAATASPGSVLPAPSIPASGNSATVSPGTVAVSSTRALSGNVGTGATGAIAASPSVALIGNGAAGAVGTVTQSHSGSSALTGNAATGNPGSVQAPGDAISPSGVAGIAGVGTASPSSAIALSGASATAAIGAAAPVTMVAISGNSASGVLGDVSADVNRTAALSGVVGTGVTGVVAPASAAAVSGLAVTAAVGDVSQSHAGSSAITGNQAFGAVGAVGTTAAGSSSATGVQGAGQAGATHVAVEVALSGVSATALAGDAVATPEIAVSGNDAAGETGDVVALSANVTQAIGGVSAIGRVGSVVPIGGIPRRESVNPKYRGADSRRYGSSTSRNYRNKVAA